MVGRVNPIHLNAFLNFWDKYPNKKGKEPCKKIFLKYMEVGEKPDEIMSGLDAYIKNKPENRDWLHPQTFLNQKRWTDEWDDRPKKPDNTAASAKTDGYYRWWLEPGRDDMELTRREAKIEEWVRKEAGKKTTDQHAISKMVIWKHFAIERFALATMLYEDELRDQKYLDECREACIPDDKDCESAERTVAALNRGGAIPQLWQKTHR